MRFATYVASWLVFLCEGVGLTSRMGFSQWHRTESALSQTFEEVRGAVTGKVASPGHLRVLSESEVGCFLLFVYVSNILEAHCSSFAPASIGEEARPQGDLIVNVHTREPTAPAGRF